jgi:hypothetical protein
VLDPFYEYIHIHAALPKMDCFIEVVVVQRLQACNLQMKSSVLGIFGRATLSQESLARSMTLHYVQAARTAGIPWMSYFKEKSSKTPPAGRSNQGDRDRSFTVSINEAANLASSA